MFALVKADERYKPIMQLFQDEYRNLLSAMGHQPRNPDGWTLVDCNRHSEGLGKFNPVTFADVICDENGVEKPIEPNLISDGDSCTKQAIDYIFWLLPNSLLDLPQILSRVPNCSIPTLAPLASNRTSDSQDQPSRLRVAVEKTKLEKLPVDGYIFKYSSDHFGISTVIE